jgi:two-component system sensor histidine kinase GlrK
LRILIDNLLSNAIKFTPDGGRIAIVDGRKGDMWFFEVRDSGSGIAPGDRERVFQPFYQGSSRNAMHVKGTGLGLSIAREIARAHGGELSVPEGAGGRIRLILPLNRNPEER